MFGVQPHMRVGLSGVLYRLEKTWKAILLMPSLTIFNMLKDGWRLSVNIFKHLEYSFFRTSTIIRFGELLCVPLFCRVRPNLLIQPLLYSRVAPVLKLNDRLS